jgi:hypothetical protein
MNRHLKCFFLAFVMSLAAVRLAAQTFSTIFTFQPQQPQLVGGLAADFEGNLYGTTALGGAYKAGVVFKLAKPATTGGAYKFSVIHDFDGASGGSNGGALVLDKSGNIYGAAIFGGNTSACTSGCGIIFELARPSSSGTAWNFSIVYSFQGYPVDGAWPSFLMMNGHGVLFGTTSIGGTGNLGTVFQLTRSGSSWTESQLFDPSSSRVPCNPPGPITFDPSGNIFFKTLSGGRYNTGCVMELTPPIPPATNWNARTLLTFGNGVGGTTPEGPVLLDSSGNLFGVTLNGGIAQGTFYEVTRSGGGWTESVLYEFGSTAGGLNPVELLPGPSSGTYYGSAINNTTGGSGAIFQLNQPTTQGGAWTQTDLYSFPFVNGGDYPYNLTKGRQGALYGSTTYGGYIGEGCPIGCGTIFKISF